MANDNDIVDKIMTWELITISDISLVTSNGEMRSSCSLDGHSATLAVM